MSRGRALGVAALAALALAPAAAAQRVAPSSGRRCTGQRINSITVLTLPPLEQPETEWWQTRPHRMIATHGATKPEVVTALLVVHAGEVCTEFRLQEAERVLRAQPFIADAHITVLPDSAGEVSLLVQTQDEFTFIIAARFSAQSPYVTSLTVGDGDLDGSGNAVVANWTHTVDREGFGAAWTDYAFLGRPWQMQAAAARGQLGVTSWLADISHPFYSDFQPSAWRGSLLDATLLAPFQRANDSAFNVAWTRQYFFAGAAHRIGHPGSVALFGIAASGEYDATGFPASGYDSTVPYDTLLARYAPRHSVRVNLIAQYRSIHYRRGFRFGTVNGAQDLRTGLDLEALVGRGLGGLDEWQPDLFVTGTFFAGAASRSDYAYLQSIFESRRGANTDAWTDAISSARLLWYHRATKTNTFVTDLEFGGGWNTTRPFELDLGQPDGGVRGYEASHDAGGSRAALKLEDRWFLKTFFHQVDLGAFLFADAGKVWAGDVPFGTTTPVKLGIGGGFIAAAPSGSRRSYRLDLEVPISPDPYARWEVRLTVVNIAELGSIFEPPDVRISRELVTTSSSFNFPR